MAGIDKLDKNFVIETQIEREGLTFFQITEEPFSVYGLIRENDEWVRMPDTVAKSVSEGVHSLSKHTSGGRVRFVTDSPYIVIKAETPGAYMMPHMPETGLGGFDLYESNDGRAESYVKTFIPTVPPKPELEGVIDFLEPRERVCTINFPLYCPVKNLYIGLKSGSVLKKSPEYDISLPFVYYGNSITQGGCASRPGNSYQAMITRRYNADHVNLGFSGNGKGEPEMVEYIAGLAMSAFVMDYDHNAPTIEHLRKTHKPLFDAVRAAHPDIPIIMLSRPKPKLTKEEVVRADIIKETYDTAVASGDKNVYFIHGTELAELCESDGTVDGCHPNDLGFYSMYVRLARLMDTLFEVKK